jgi:cytochrome c oxidase subunit II
MKVHRYEKAFLAAGAAMLVLFLGALLYASVGMGMHLPGAVGRIDPKKVYQTAPFDAPGVREVAPGRYEAVVVGQAFAFNPGEIRVPRGAEVTFTATTVDVIHGFAIEGTRVNVMLIPGQVTRVVHRFDRPGEYLLLCHEYCGVGHHAMAGKVIVEDAPALAGTAAAAPATPTHEAVHP